MEKITHAYCENCGIVPVEVEPMEARDTSGKYLGGDIVCSKCALIVATVFRLPTGKQAKKGGK